MSADLDLALRLADAADAIALSRFRARDLVVETKPDSTPVTEADRAVEAELRTILALERRRDAVLGEEEGQSGSSARRWIVDPIDGTRNYSRGVPVWATLIALEDHGRVVLGVVSAPALHRRWWAERGEGAHANGDVVRVSRIARPEDAVLTFALEQSLPSLAGRAWHARGYGDFWSHMLVAEGAVDLAAEPQVALHDLAAPAIVVTEAGGRFTSLDGTAGPAGGTAVATNGLLHDEVLQRLVP